MKKYKAYCLDLDGTVYRGNLAIESAISFIHSLQEQGVEPFYVTNNSSKTAEQLQEKLASFGVKAPLHHIYSSAFATATYIKNNFPNSPVQLIGSDGIYEALLANDIKIVDKDSPVLVMGIDRAINYEKLANACFAVQNGAQLIGTNEDIKFPTENGFVPGNGSFVNLVANVANVQPIFIGKPSPIMLEIIAAEHHFNKEEIVMIGDNYETDILCGINFGCDTVHVNTGVTPTTQVLEEKKQPTYCVPSLEECV